METSDRQKKEFKGFKEKYLNKKAILIFICLVIVIITGAGAGLVKTSDNPAFCSVCHIMKPYYESWKSGDLLANKHASAGITCHQCHESSISVQAEEGIKFVTGDYKDPLDKRDFGTREFCLECHNFDEVKAATNFEESNPHDNHNGKQECNTCHSMHQQSNLMCSNCHEFSWMNDLNGSWKKQ
jgi:nitrate/TMAO reductase-like tetraheme cytochrome c subunit